MKTFEDAWSEAPWWRKTAAFLMWLSLWPTEQQIMNVLFGPGWDE